MKRKPRGTTGTTAMGRTSTATHATGNSFNAIENRLWSAADELRANSKLKASEYGVPVLGLIFLRYADHKFSHAEKELSRQASGRRRVGKTDYHARGVLYLPAEARFWKSRAYSTLIL